MNFPGLNEIRIPFKKNKNTWQGIKEGPGNDKSQSVRISEGKVYISIALK